jgi:hypothetical protein
MRRFGILAVAAVFVDLVVFVGCGSRGSISELSNPDRHDRRPKTETDSDKTQPNLPSAPENGRFPTHPHSEVTPGSLCERASEMRYPERVKYCDRDVDGSLKAQLFVMYDREFGYETTKMERSDFKIDHLIPLCLGGSNDADNLWPQHKSIYEQTDPLEPFLCGTLAEGKVKQAEAVQIILAIKQNPFNADNELRKLEARF